MEFPSSSSLRTRFGSVLRLSNSNENPEMANKDHERDAFTSTIFSWSLDDIFNLNPHLLQVDKIPERFQSVEHYFRTFVPPLLEETRAQLHSSMEMISQAPFAELTDIRRCEPYETFSYKVCVDYWSNRTNKADKEPYRTLPGDVIILTNAKPETAEDLQRCGSTWCFAMVKNIKAGDNEDDVSSTMFTVMASKELGLKNPHFAVFLENIATNRRVWHALHMLKNVNIIKEVLCTESKVQEDCSQCSPQSGRALDKKIGMHLSWMLNESQTGAVAACLRNLYCNHKSSVELIWGPPGTGKTKTVSVLLFNLLRLKKFRTLICAPTNVAITEVASRVVKLVTECHGTDLDSSDPMFPPCLGTDLDSSDPMFPPCLGNILLFGNKKKLKLSSEIDNIFLDDRVERLIQCLGRSTGWWNSLMSAINFFENTASQYPVFLENEMKKQKKNFNGKPKSFLEFARERYLAVALQLKRSIFHLRTDMPEGFIRDENVQYMRTIFRLLDSFETLLFGDGVMSEELERLFSLPVSVEVSFKGFAGVFVQLQRCRDECISMLRTLRNSLSRIEFPNPSNERSIKEFCFKAASLIFCTVSSSYKLHWLKELEPFDLLVIDEAAQLKECESAIPLQLPGIRKAVLIGDEYQLPAMVQSNLSGDAGFGRSLFERLSLLGHPKHLLNMQYRMHPSISSFPSSMFYSNRITDAPNVRHSSYEKRYLPGLMFGPYSFINVIGGREDRDEMGHSRKNMVEVAVVLKIVGDLYRVWSNSNKELSVGVISPYAAQVAAIQEKLCRKYENTEGFSVNVKSVDGFQGSEEDVIIVSTVRCNTWGALGFLSNSQRANVSITRARHCLWILGSERTLSVRESVWEVLVRNAKSRQCFFNSDEDEELTKTIIEAKKECDQLGDLLHAESLSFKSARWKVLFSQDFKKSFEKLASVHRKSAILDTLVRLSGGWRPKLKVDIICERSKHILKKFRTESLYILCSIDIVKEIGHTQALKVWDILPPDDIPRLVKRLDGIFVMYTEEFIHCCNEKWMEGDLEVPKVWYGSYNAFRFKGRNTQNTGNDGKCYAESTKVNESLLLMKFYSLSSGVANHLLFNRDGREIELPFELTDEQSEMVQFERSSFILGRSGTGKTTVLTMKVFKREQMYHVASEGLSTGIANTSTDVDDRVEDVEDTVEEPKKTVLHQLFVTVSPKLCYAVKQQLQSFFRGGKCSAENITADMVENDDISQSNSFFDILPESYPLVITFYKFLMMLDGTVGTSYFSRFSDVRQLLHGKKGVSGSIALRTLIEKREVNFDKFSSVYWPHFNLKLTNGLDSSRVYTEIISHIKGGLHAGILSRENYAKLSDSRMSSLTIQKREIIYDIFEAYEKTKLKKGDFDVADLVNDLHRRLQNKRYEGDMVDFVYIDEVQDLTLRQIALFKHICKNVNEGFVFSGDTAQSIARGIDFRFEDVRSLFYNEFVSPLKPGGNDGRKEKGQLSKVFHLTQNFRTHAGILKLAQSVVELLYHFFPLSVDILPPETSCILGEAPVLLEPQNENDAVATIFGNDRNAAGKGFGAKQVILVRDEPTKKEFSNSVGKQALVLTILECKGLEFQDVLLYNFFGSSPLKNKWKLVYEYMKDKDLLQPSYPESFPSFNEAKHNILCSELKQLYVAITRTRQRLWIYENTDEFSTPMFEYWKMKALVQVRKLDNSFAQEMKVVSSPEDRKSQGHKLLIEGNYEMATMCFERAGDAHGEKLAKAAGFKASADRFHGSNPEMASAAYREAAEIFQSIGKTEFAAECSYMFKECLRQTPRTTKYPSFRHF